MTLILGIGTGRCGTNSLANLLNEQRGAQVTHERFRANVPWGCEGFAWLRRLLAVAPGEGVLFGDVAFYWLPQVERLIEAFPDRDVRVAALRRDKQATVDSYLRKTPERNHWQLHHSEDYDVCELGWDKCFPKFQAASKKEALAMYWSSYYGEVARLERTYPALVRCFDMEALNSEAGQRAILRFVGKAREEQRLLPGLCKNRGRQPPSPLRRFAQTAKKAYARIF